MEVDRKQELTAGKGRTICCYTLSVVTYRCCILGVVTNHSCYMCLLL